MYKFIGYPGNMYEIQIKLNANCSNEEKGGRTGPGSCGGSKPYIKSEDKFSKTMSIQEIEKYMSEKYDYIILDLKGCTPTLATKVAKSVDNFATNYKEVSYNINTITVSKIEDSPYAMTDDNNNITLDQNWFQKTKLLEESLKDDVDSGFHVVGCDSVEALVTHELGHVLLGYMKENIKGFDSWLQENLNELQKISKYAMVDDHEAFAEAFCSMKHTPLEKQLPIIKKYADYVNRSLNK